MQNAPHFFPCKIQTLQPISVYTGDRREQFANDLPQKIDASKADVGSNWFSDKAYFYLNSIIDKTDELEKQKIPMFQCSHHCDWGKKKKNHDL